MRKEHANLVRQNTSYPTTRYAWPYTDATSVLHPSCVDLPCLVVQQEQTRLDLQHHVAKRLLNGKLGMAPVDKPGRVLDVGTGTGKIFRETSSLRSKLT
jgi:hypothetical protein